MNDGSVACLHAILVRRGVVVAESDANTTAGEHDFARVGLQRVAREGQAQGELRIERPRGIEFRQPAAGCKAIEQRASHDVGIHGFGTGDDFGKGGGVFLKLVEVHGQDPIRVEGGDDGVEEFPGDPGVEGAFEPRGGLEPVFIEGDAEGICGGEAFGLRELGIDMGCEVEGINAQASIVGEEGRKQTEAPGLEQPDQGDAPAPMVSGRRAYVPGRGWR